MSPFEQAGSTIQAQPSEAEQKNETGLVHGSGHQRPLDVVFKDVTVSIDNKIILNEVSGEARPGEMVAILGRSGSGKTTLLDTIGGRGGTNLRRDRGVVTFNGVKLTKQMRRKICYVTQEDIFFVDLTLRQTLTYAALLRLPERMSHKQKIAHVDNIIDILDLRGCQDTRIGDSQKRGLSGGEKKRASIACELLTNPALMLLDEPTSGLDSSSALSLVCMLKQYAERERKTIIMTVHQPSSHIFHMFDKLLLLHKGQMAYFGKARKVVNFFETQGYTMEKHFNPADFIMEQINKSSEITEKLIAAAKELRKNYNYKRELETRRMEYDSGPVCEELENRLSDSGNMESTETQWTHRKTMDVRVVIDADTKTPAVYSRLELAEDDDSGRSSLSDAPCSGRSSVSGAACSDYESSVEDLDEDTWPTFFTTQFKVLTGRNFVESRGRILSLLNWIHTVGLGFIAAMLWFQVPRTESGLNNIKGWMFFSSSYWMLFALFGSLVSFPAEREVIRKERLSGSYRLSAYYFAKMVGELPLQITLPMVYHIMSHLALGCSSASEFFALLWILLLGTLVAQSVGIFISTLCMDVQKAVTCASLYSLATMLLGGFYVSTNNPALSWLKYASMVNYAFQNMQLVAFQEGSPPFLCESTKSIYESCVNNSTYIAQEEILAGVGNDLPFWANSLCLLGYLCLFRLLGYLALRFLHSPK